jgi:REP element-mobilizing transposase RayT
MSRRPIAFHVILSTYGFWLPNDPRGSWSRFIRSPVIRREGPPIMAEGRRSVAHARHDIAKRRAAKLALRRPAVVLTGQQAVAIGQGFQERTTTSGYSVHACAIMPDHVHLVVMRHRYKVEQVIRALRQSASVALVDAGLHPFVSDRTPSGRLPSVWSRGLWKVFLFSDADIRRSIRYVEDNPVRSGLRRQCWSFVRPFSPATDASSMRR